MLWAKSLLVVLISGGVFAQTIQVRLTSPVKNGHYPRCQDVLLSAIASVQGGNIKQVEFYVNRSRLKTVTKAPYETTLAAAREGMYLVSAKAVATDGSSAESEPFYIYVGDIEPGNMIINGNFNCGLSPWFLDNYVNARSKATVVEDLGLTDDKPGVMVEIENMGDQFWAIQLMQPFKIQAGHSYEITFWAQADQAKDIYVDINKNYGDYSQLYSKMVRVEQLDLYGPFTFDAPVDDDNLMFKFVLGGNTTTFYVDAVKVIDKQWTEVEEKPQAPACLTLLQNYPNPFNPSTTIEFELDRKAPIVLEVFDLLGRPLYRYAAVKEAGHHTILWDGRSADGLPCPSGVYFYRLKTVDGSLTRKMNLIR
ncbi:MAG: carbohydrate binding domain-containing protein [candidate division KSB1 bacterium]|nr:carbohydrate binding domain-containing protein [candidate division KSB1 bacterium]